MTSVLQRFSDPEIEHAFLRAERRQRGPAIRALIVIALVTLFSYILLNPLYFPRDGVVAYAAAAGALIMLLSGFFLLTRTEYYLDRPWIDLPVFDQSPGSKRTPLHERGVTAEAGLYFLGLPWLHKWKSAFLFGADEDAAFLGAHIVPQKGN